MADLGLSLPIVDLEGLVGEGSTLETRASVAESIDSACREYGFFYIKNHGVGEGLQHRLVDLSRAFFALPIPEKEKVKMELGGRAWRGFFRVGDEVTAGIPDVKEGLYLGSEFGPDHPEVAKGAPMYGRNLFPDEEQWGVEGRGGIQGIKEAILEYLDAMLALGMSLMKAVSLALGHPEDFFAAEFMSPEPLSLFRIFNYPPTPEHLAGGRSKWGVAEHTDYGILTILRQDDDLTSGLQVKHVKGEWIEAPTLPGTFVVNVGDMLEKMSGGRWRSTPHRVRQTGPSLPQAPRGGALTGRISFPYFLDPNPGAKMRTICAKEGPVLEGNSRWDGEEVLEYEGSYGEYVLNKVSKVFPQLAQSTELQSETH